MFCSSKRQQVWDYSRRPQIYNLCGFLNCLQLHMLPARNFCIENCPGGRSFSVYDFNQWSSLKKGFLQHHLKKLSAHRWFFTLEFVQGANHNASINRQSSCYRSFVPTPTFTAEMNPRTKPCTHPSSHEFIHGMPKFACSTVSRYEFCTASESNGKLTTLSKSSAIRQPIKVQALLRTFLIRMNNCKLMSVVVF